MENDIDELDSFSHSFIIKIWLEETAQESGKVRWRGHITHVISGKRRYFQSLSDIDDFINPYLEDKGAEA